MDLLMLLYVARNLPVKDLVTECLSIPTSGDSVFLLGPSAPVDSLAMMSFL